MHDPGTAGAAPVTEQHIVATVGEFVRRNFLYDGRSVGEEESLTQSGIVDSTGILELIEFIEATYRIKFGDADLVADNFDSLRTIGTFVGAKLRT
jgi:acyl carrier protein